MSNKMLLGQEAVAKKKKTAKIVALAISSVVFVLALLIVIAACVPVNLRPNFIYNPDRVAIYNKTTEYAEFASENQDKYNKFMDKFNSIFSASYLVSLFSGRLGDYDIEESTANLYLSDVKKELETGYYVEFKYDSPVIMIHSNGDPYKSIFYSNTNIYFTSVLFALSEEDGLTNVDFYAAFTQCR